MHGKPDRMLGQKLKVTEYPDYSKPRAMHKSRTPADGRSGVRAAELVPWEHARSLAARRQEDNEEGFQRISWSTVISLESC